FLARISTGHLSDRVRSARARFVHGSCVRPDRRSVPDRRILGGSEDRPAAHWPFCQPLVCPLDHMPAHRCYSLDRYYRQLCRCCGRFRKEPAATVGTDSRGCNARPSGRTCWTAHPPLAPADSSTGRRLWPGHELIYRYILLAILWRVRIV